MAAFDVTGRCANYQGPSLVAWGRLDQLNAPLCRDLAIRLSDCRTAEIASAGHVANLDAPGCFSKLVSDFIN